MEHARLSCGSKFQTYEDLDLLIQQTEAEWGLPPIYQLPDEVIYIIFDHLDFNDLMQCYLVCNKWNGIISGNPKRFLADPIFQGTIEKVNKQWLCYNRLRGKVRIRSLVLNIRRQQYDDDPPTQFWNTTHLHRFFPYEDLKEFSCESYVDDQTVAQGLWHRVQSCHRLEKLDWKIVSPGMTFDVAGFALAQCRLKEFKFCCSVLSPENTHFSFPQEFYAIVRQATTIAFVIEYTKSRVIRGVHGLLKAAANTLQVLNVELPSTCTYLESSQELEMIQFQQLQSIRLKHFEYGKLFLYAPTVGTLTIERSKKREGIFLDAVACLMRSCWENLVTLTYVHFDQRSYNFFIDGILHHLCKCKTLTLHGPWWASNPEYTSFFHIYRTIGHNDTSSILPKLENLNLDLCVKERNGYLLVDFLKARENLNYSRLKLSLSGKVSLDQDAINSVIQMADLYGNNRLGTSPLM